MEYDQQPQARACCGDVSPKLNVIALDVNISRSKLLHGHIPFLSQNQSPDKTSRLVLKSRINYVTNGLPIDCYVRCSEVGNSPLAGE